MNITTQCLTERSRQPTSYGNLNEPSPNVSFANITVKSTQGIPKYRTRVLYVPQRPSLLPGTPRDFLTAISSFSARSQPQPHRHTNARDLQQQQQQHPIDVAKGWGIDEALWDREWSFLSGGESQRVALAVAVGLDVAEVLLLDGQCICVVFFCLSGFDYYYCRTYVSVGS